ncbi:hypothetical protein [Selenomonas ruminantium]|uniref:hypothetical protein n=1 Tax=Selenomonas ruminantium TaxID=971 RepID=UPI0012FF5130|nr:hypothetical protein [Selenomonas ruminantium]
MRRPEHPQGLETDDWNAAGMEPHSPTAARLQRRKVSAASRNASGIPRWAGLSTRAAGHKPNTHERRAGFHYSIRSALGNVGRSGDMPVAYRLAARVIPLRSRWGP